MSTRTGLETQPLQRMAAEDVGILLDTVLSESDCQLLEHLPVDARLVDYVPYSLSLFYHEGEEYMSNYAGYQTLYHGFRAPAPITCRYGCSDFVCWNGKDTKAADAVRMAQGLRRYRLFVRIASYTSNHQLTFTWQFGHAGQLLL